ncbi:transporter [Aquimarina agarivorans]|uniref:transporter n=1 Tax=Aquimarina agarivorans TaxID=980584 RepID=UPI0002D457E4|nr:transporter [Aquimarina agarivorans]
MKYPQILTFLILFFVSICVKSQHTEIINTYRPGTSQGAFSVGKNVIQIEGGLTFGRLRHRIFNNKTRSTAFEYNFRAGLFKEQLEFSIQGSYLNNNVSELVGDQTSFVDKGFPSNVIGAKYLVYDPYKYQREKSENLYSWKKNNSFQWKKLIPAVSAYVGANFSSSSSDFAFQNNPDNRATEPQANITPKVIIAAQNNWAYNWVFVANIVADRITSEFPDYRFILTSTYNLNDKWSIFGEYEAANSKIYKDHLLKIGGSFLISKDFAIDAHAVNNVKDTPSLFAVNIGASYRLDYHKLEDYERIQTAEQRDLDKTIEQIKKDIEEGFLPPETMTGKLDGKVDLEEYVEEEVEEEEDFDEDFEDSEDVEIPKKKKWFQFWKGSGKRKARRDAKRRSKEELNDSTSTTVSSKPVLGSGGRMSDFVDDEFIQSKQEEITPEERTEEELAEIEERNSKKKRKKRRKKNEPRIDPETGEPYPEPDYTGMTKKERKAAKKQEKLLRSFEDEISDLENEIEAEQSARDKKREQKRLEKEARKKNKKNKNKGDASKGLDNGFDQNDLSNDGNSKKEENNIDNLFDDISSDAEKEEKERLKKEAEELKALEAEIELLEKQVQEEQEEKPKKKRKKDKKKKKGKKKKKKKDDDEDW